jgi:hypothetical protein
MAEASKADVAPDSDQLAEQFFSQPPPQAWEVALDDWQPRPLSAAERRAMHATFGLLALGATAALGLALFPDAIVIRPAPLGPESGRSHVALAQPHADVAQHGIAALAHAGAQLDDNMALTDVAPRPEQKAAAPEPQPERVPADQKKESAATATSSVTALAASPSADTTASTIKTTSPSKKLIAHAKPTSRSPVAAEIERARQALNAGRAGEARYLAERALRSDPAHASAYIVLAGALDALGDRAGMKAAFRNCSAHATDALVSACRTLAR